MKTKRIDNLRIDFTDSPEYVRMTYLLMPISIDEREVESWCSTGQTNVAIVAGFDWDNDMTPWAAPGVPKGTADFKGDAKELLTRLTTKVVPEIEAGMRIDSRNLIGVSLSGLFALWAWVQGGEFENICSLSGSFWYEGFVSWLSTYPIPKKSGRALFELGTEEPKSKQKVFATVGRCTSEVIEILRKAGVETTFEWVPGTHYSPLGPRLAPAFEFLGNFKQSEN